MSSEEWRRTLTVCPFWLRTRSDLRCAIRRAAWQARCADGWPTLRRIIATTLARAWLSARYVTTSPGISLWLPRAFGAFLIGVGVRFLLR